MYHRVMKNLNIRQKLIFIYIHMTVWTLPYIIGAIVIINLLIGDNDLTASDVLIFYVPITIVYSAVYVGFTILLGRALTKQIVFPLRETIKNVKKIGNGDLNVEFEHEGKDEVSLVIHTLEEMAESIKRETEIMGRIAEGDYTVDIKLRGQNDVVYKSYKGLIEMNSRFISEIKDAATQISSGATEIASGAQNLASGSNQQASTIEEFSTSIADVKSKADENMETAEGTLRDIDDNTRLMQENIEEIRKVNDFIDELAKDSQQIAKVIKVIDDIAFQTNILALNAAVEAARAGQHGKGFAVVADEVRELASKSAQAAKETSDLIKKSLKNVNEGSVLVEKTNTGIEQMGEIALKNQSSMTKMSEASIKQGNSITEIDQGIAQITNVVQANSSMAQESAAAAEEMSAQSEHLNILISRFKTKEDVISYNEDEAYPDKDFFNTPSNYDQGYKYEEEPIASKQNIYESVSDHDGKNEYQDDNIISENSDVTDKENSVEKADIKDFFPETDSLINEEGIYPEKFHDFSSENPDLEDFSKIVVPNKYSDD